MSLKYLLLKLTLTLAALAVLSPVLERTALLRTSSHAQAFAGHATQQLIETARAERPAGITTLGAAKAQDEDLMTKIFGPGPCKRVTEKTLRDEGPQLPEVFNMSNFTVQALVKDGWDLGFELKLEEGATATITVTTVEAAPFVSTFIGTGDRQKQSVKLALTGAGNKFVPGIISFLAVKREGTAGAMRLAKNMLYKLSCGFAADGDVIKIIKFGPNPVYSKQSVDSQFEILNNNYNEVRLDFLVQPECPPQKQCGPVPLNLNVELDKTSNNYYSYTWDGRAGKRRKRRSVGFHYLLVVARREPDEAWEARTTDAIYIER
jgi:hypothetical protein